MKIKLSNCVTIALVTLALVGGYTMGKYHAIHQAELHTITEHGYNINFGNEIHAYTFGN